MNFNLLWLSACFQGFSIWYKHTCFCSNNVSSLNRVGLIAMAQSIRTAHSYSASENVLVAPGDGKFQTLIKKFVIRCREIFFSLHTSCREIFFLVSRVEKRSNYFIFIVFLASALEKMSWSVV